MHSEKLTALDAGFLEAEDADPHVSMAIGALAMLEGPCPQTEAFTAAMSERIHQIPRCTQVLQAHGWDLEAPEWRKDEAFDVRHHVRRTAVPLPGDARALFGVVAEIMERRLERSRPLWECWMIDGLPDGQWAIVIKIHHCMADGISAGAMLADLCDRGPLETFATDLRPAVHADGEGGSSLPSLNPLDWLNDGWHFSRAAVRTAVRVATGAAQIASGIVSPAPQSITGPLSDLRRYAAVTVSLSDVRSVCQRFGVTVNDVALAAITDSVRSAMLQRGDEISPNSLRTLVPVSLRAPDELHVPDNRVSMMLPLLPVDLPDPLQRLQAVHERMSATKSSGQRSAGSLAVSMSNLLPFAVTAWAVRFLARLPQHGIVTIATNVPGPRQTVAIMGRTVLSLMPVPPIAVHLRIGIAITSYVDDLVFGIIGDFDAPVDVDVLAAGIADGVERLVGLNAACKRSRRIGNLVLLTS